MQRYHYQLSGEDCTIHCPGSLSDISEFKIWAKSKRGQVVGLDTETTGLELYSTDHVRLVQFGDTKTAWVLNAQTWKTHIRDVLSDPALTFVAHNAPFDTLGLIHHGFADEGLIPRVRDTHIYAHLVDPFRPLDLKSLCQRYVDSSAPDTQTSLYATFRTEYKATKETGWAKIDIDHPDYVLYAGLDALLVSRLLVELAEAVRAQGTTELCGKEHRVLHICMKIRHKGLLLDTDYTSRLLGVYHDRGEAARAEAARLGVPNVNADAQIVTMLQEMGEELTEKTDTGKLSVAGNVLRLLADTDAYGKRLNLREPNPLAVAIIEAKRVGKWSKTYVQAFLDKADSVNVLHPSIKTLGARTGRMSSSSPNFQNLPSHETTIRRCIIARDGGVIGSVDYQALELRLLAALAQVPGMLSALADGQDLHSTAATAMYGPDYTSTQRGYAKAVAYGITYGGGVSGVATMSGLPEKVVKEAFTKYNSAYPEITSYQKRVQASALSLGEIHTMTGRVIPVDRTAAYRAVNHGIQSLAADVLKGAIVRADAAGLTPYILMPIHDELLFEASAKEAPEIAAELQRAMTTRIKGVDILTDAKIGGNDWGTLAK